MIQRIARNEQPRNRQTRQTVRLSVLKVKDLLREIELYRSALDAGQLGTAACYGTVIDAGAERYFLFNCTDASPLPTPCWRPTT